MKFWHTNVEWYKYAPCFGITDFTLPPERDDDGPVADKNLITSMCAGCRVRPECGQSAYLEQWNGVWSCGTWIPGHDTDKRAAERIRRKLMDAFPDELEARGEDV